MIPLSPSVIGDDILKVYDCFTFYNEFELLELRLKALWDVVDKFVIVEANRTHNNKPKPFYFWERQDEFREFFPKIIHLPVEMNVPYKGTGDWSIENAQRDAIIYGLEDAAPDDLIFISDLDEIPAPDILKRLQENKLSLIVNTFFAEKNITCPAQLLVPAADFLEFSAIATEQKLFYYYFDLFTTKTWHGSILTKRKNLTTPQKLRNLRNNLPRALRGGYHFSYMGGIDRVIDKMTSIVDGNELVEKSGGKLIDRKYVEEAMDKGESVYKIMPKGSKSKFIPYDARNIKLPHIEEFLRKYPQFLREPEKYFNK